jgi:hypothetical protein
MKIYSRKDAEISWLTKPSREGISTECLQIPASTFDESAANRKT